MTKYICIVIPTELKDEIEAIAKQYQIDESENCNNFSVRLWDKDTNEITYYACCTSCDDASKLYNDFPTLADLYPKSHYYISDSTIEIHKWFNKKLEELNIDPLKEIKDSLPPPQP